jgi:hypothetical protein
MVLPVATGEESPAFVKGAGGDYETAQGFVWASRVVRGEVFG